MVALAISKVKRVSGAKFRYHEVSNRITSLFIKGARTAEYLDRISIRRKPSGLSTLLGYVAVSSFGQHWIPKPSQQLSGISNLHTALPDMKNIPSTHWLKMPFDPMLLR